MVRFKSVTYGSQTSDCDDLGIGKWIFGAIWRAASRWVSTLEGLSIWCSIGRSTRSKLAPQISNRPKLFCDGLQESLSWSEVGYKIWCTLSVWFSFFFRAIVFCIFRPPWAYHRLLHKSRGLNVQLTFFLGHWSSNSTGYCHLNGNYLPVWPWGRLCKLVTLKTMEFSIYRND